MDFSSAGKCFALFRSFDLLYPSHLYNNVFGAGPCVACAWNRCLAVSLKLRGEPSRENFFFFFSRRMLRYLFIFEACSTDWSWLHGMFITAGPGTYYYWSGTCKFTPYFISNTLKRYVSSCPVYRCCSYSAFYPHVCLVTRGSGRLLRLDHVVVGRLWTRCMNK